MAQEDEGYTVVADKLTVPRDRALSAACRALTVEPAVVVHTVWVIQLILPKTGFGEDGNHRR